MLGAAIVAAGGDSIYKYTWKPLAGLNDSTLAHPSATPAKTTTYVLLVTDSNGCKGKDTAVIVVNNLPNSLSPYSPDTMVCAGSSSYINVPSSQTGIRYDMTIMQNVVSSEYGTGSLLNFSTGSMELSDTFRIWATDTLTGCKVLLTPSIPLLVTPIADIQYTILGRHHVRDTVQFSTPVGCADSWKWSFEGVSSVSSDSIPNPVVTYDVPGRYKVLLYAHNPAANNGEKSLKSLYIRIDYDWDNDDSYTVGIVNSGPQTICAGNPVTIDVGGLGGTAVGNPATLAPFAVTLEGSVHVNPSTNSQAYSPFITNGPTGSYTFPMPSTIALFGGLDGFDIQQINGAEHSTATTYLPNPTVYFIGLECCNNNLLTNGDFATSSGIVSDLSSSSNQQAGSYSVYDPSNGVGAGNWFVYENCFLQDLGNAMCVDVAPTATSGIYTKLWKQTGITINSCTDYIFGFNTTAVDPSTIVNLQFALVPTGAGQTVYPMGGFSTYYTVPSYTIPASPIPATNDVVWYQNNTNWNSGNISGTYNLELYQVNPQVNTSNSQYCLDNLTLSQVNCFTSATVTLNQSICPGEQINIGLQNAPTDATVTWSSNPPGFTSSSLYPAVLPRQNTTYTAIYTTPCGITKTVNNIITVDQISVNINVVNPYCRLYVPLTANVTNALGVVSYLWDATPTAGLSSTTIGSPIVTQAGTYSVTVTDGVSVTDGRYCTATTTAIIQNEINVSAAISNYSCATGSEVADITTTVTGGSGTLRYDWADGPTTPNRTAIPPGSYNLVVADGAGCYASTSLSYAAFTVTLPPADIQDIYCGIGVIWAYPLNNSVPFNLTYQWSGPMPMNVFPSNILGSVQVYNPGIYSVTATDLASGCSASASATVIAAAPLTPLTYTVTRQSCNGLATITVAPSTFLPYFWSDQGAGTYIRTNMADGTYSVSVGNQYCNESTTIIITTGIGIAISSTATCAGGSTGTASATGSQGAPPYSYHWDNGQNSSTATNLATGVYSVTVTDAIGCSSTSSVTVDNPSVSINTPTQLDLCTYLASSSLTASSNLSNPTYAWSNGGSTQSITVNTPGNYSITVTDAGCSATSIVTVSATPNSSNCCQGSSIPGSDETYTFSSADYPSLNSILNAFPSAFNSGNTVALNGVFNTTGNFYFVNVHFVMGGYSRINVVAGDVLDMLNCQISGCNEMWDGIYVQGGRFAMWGTAGTGLSVLSDALNGTVLQQTALVFELQGTSFYRNLYSIQINNFAALPYQYDVSGNYFGFNGPLLSYPPHGIIPTPLSDHPYAGIYIANSSGILIPNPFFPTTANLANTFENINCGIVVENSSVNIYSNNFNQIKHYGNMNSSNMVFGSAIYAKGRPGVGSNNLVVQTDPAFTNIPRFTNCDYGINATSIPVNIEYSAMSNVVHGINATNCYLWAKIHANAIGNTTYGITLNNGSGIIQNITNNLIFVNEPIGVSISGGFPAASYGISQTSPGYSTTGIVGNCIFGGRYCITLMNANNDLISLNYLYQYGTATGVSGEQAGIYAANCTNLDVTGNIITGNGTSYTGGNQKSGISYFLSRGGQICNNTLGDATGIGYGIYMTAHCSMVKIIDNNIYSSRYGMVLFALGLAATVIDAQGDVNTSSGNQFFGGFASGYRSYSFAGGNFLPPVFYYNAASESPIPTATFPATNRIITAQHVSGLSHDCTPFFIMRPGRLKDLRNPVNETIAKRYASTLMMSGFESTGPWLEERMLYQSLCDSGQTAFTGNPLPDGYDTILETFIDTSTDKFMLSAASDLYAQIIDTTRYAVLDSSALVDSAFANFYDWAQGTDLNAIQTYSDQLKTLTSSVVMNDTMAYDSIWQIAETLRTAIPEEHIQALNFKTVQNIYLHVLARRDTFVVDSVVLDLLHSIAAQCPYVAGDAVYYARALYMQYVDTVFYDDLYLCQSDTASHGSDRVLGGPKAPVDTATFEPYVSSTITIDFVKVYPNPAKQLLNLAFSAASEGIVSFEVFDQMGEIVLNHRLGNNQNFAQYSTGNLSNGMYYWKLIDSTHTIKTGKVAIMK